MGSRKSHPSSLYSHSPVVSTHDANPHHQRQNKTPSNPTQADQEGLMDSPSFTRLDMGMDMDMDMPRAHSSTAAAAATAASPSLHHSRTDACGHRRSGYYARLPSRFDSASRPDYPQRQQIPNHAAATSKTHTQPTNPNTILQST